MCDSGQQQDWLSRNLWPQWVNSVQFCGLTPTQDMLAVTDGYVTILTGLVPCTVYIHVLLAR